MLPARDRRRKSWTTSAGPAGASEEGSPRAFFVNSGALGCGLRLIYVITPRGFRWWTAIYRIREVLVIAVER